MKKGQDMTKPRSNLMALNEYLFEMMDAISNEDLQGEELQQELSRTAAKLKVAETIIANGRLSLDVMKAANEYGVDGSEKLPLLLTGE